MVGFVLLAISFGLIALVRYVTGERQASGGAAQKARAAQRRKSFAARTAGAPVQAEESRL